MYGFHGLVEVDLRLVPRLEADAATGKFRRIVSLVGPPGDLDVARAGPPRRGMIHCLCSEWSGRVSDPPRDVRVITNGRAWLPWSRGLGRSEWPIRNSSIAWAAWRPSAIAQTIRLWPRVMSPAVKTFGDARPLVGVGLDVAHRGRARRRAARACPCARGRRSPSPAGRGRRDRSSRCRGSRRTACGRSSVFISTRTVSSAVTRPSSPRNRLVLIAYSRTPPSSWAEETRKTFDHCGQGFVGVAVVGRAGDDLELVDAARSPGGGRCPGSRRRCRRRR